MVFGEFKDPKAGSDSDRRLRMLRVNVFVTNMGGERFWDVDRPLPAQVQISVNINLVGLEEKPDGSIDAPFVFTVNFAPSIAQISVKGNARISGEKEETKQILEQHRQQKPPPPQLVQAVSNVAMAEAILVSKAIGVPAPLPPITPPEVQTGPKTDSSKYA